MKLTKGKFIFGTVVLAILAVFAVGLAMGFGAQNKAVGLEEQMEESKSSISVQEKRRVDLIFNLVDTVESYNKHEEGTLTKLAEARTQAGKGNVAEAQVAINAVSEAYPELKSDKNYTQLMTELSVTENLIAEHRNNYNVQVKQYKKHVRKFPNSMTLSIMGYEVVDAEYLQYDAPVDAPQNLFDKKD